MELILMSGIYGKYILLYNKYLLIKSLYNIYLLLTLNQKNKVYIFLTIAQLLQFIDCLNSWYKN